MLEVFDRPMKRLAFLENAFDRVEVERLNEVGRLTFSLPADDPKAAVLRPYVFVRTEQGGVYRLISEGLRTAGTEVLSYEAEHAIATLVDDLMFGTVMLGGHGVPTRQVIEAILARQSVQHWKLGACDFALQYEYGYESENLINALFSVANRFLDEYQWAYDTRTYPWKVSLLRLSAEGKPAYYIRAGRNLLEGNQGSSALQVATRLYLLGYGEGDNQLTIESVNGGKAYLESPRAYIDRYGLISRVYVDRSFEDAKSLMERGQALLKALQEPRLTRTFRVAELHALTGADIDRAAVGERVRLEADGTDAFITAVTRPLDEEGAVTLEMSTSPSNIAANIADIADRQRIEQVYAQGATQIYAQSVQANASTDTQATLNFFIPQEMRIINKVMAKITMEPFRSYSRTTAGGGRTTQTSTSGGAHVSTSGYGGGATQTTSSGGETSVSAPQTITLDAGVGYTTDASSLTVTGEPHPLYGMETGPASGQTGAPSTLLTGSASSGKTRPASGTTGSASPAVSGSANGAVGPHVHTMVHAHTLNMHDHDTAAHQHSMAHTHGMNQHAHPVGAHRHSMSHTHNMWHQHTVPGHSHTLKGHTHSVSMPSHAHSVSIAGHSHNVTIPDHRHEIEQGIFRFGSPRTGRLFVGGQERLAMGTELEVDLTPYLLGSNGKVPRGSWIRLGVLPDDLAYVTIDVVVQGFVQSRGGGSF